MATEEELSRRAQRWTVAFILSSIILIAGINTMCDVLLYVGAPSFAVSFFGFFAYVLCGMGEADDKPEKREETTYNITINISTKEEEDKAKP